MHPEHTLSLMGRPHFLHGLHPHVWHMGLVSFQYKVILAPYLGPGPPSAQKAQADLPPPGLQQLRNTRRDHGMAGAS